MKGNVFPKLVNKVKLLLNVSKLSKLIKIKKQIMKTYTGDTVKTEWKDLKNWKFINNGLEKNFKFLDFT